MEAFLERPLFQMRREVAEHRPACTTSLEWPFAPDLQIRGGKKFCVQIFCLGLDYLYMLFHQWFM